MPLRPVLRAAAAGGLVVALALPTAAFAGVLMHSDPAQDVQRITTSGPSATITDAPHNKTADIVHLTARYDKQRLKETLRLRDMAGDWFLTSPIRTANHRFDLTLIRQPGSDQVTLTKGKGQTQIVCDGLVPDVDLALHTVAVTVPAECLSDPHWVRIGAGIVRRGRDRGVSFADDALRLRGVAEANLTLSRQIHQD